GRVPGSLSAEPLPMRRVHRGDDRSQDPRRQPHPRGHTLREDRSGRWLCDQHSLVRRARDRHLHVRQFAKVVSVRRMPGQPPGLGSPLIVAFKAIKAVVSLAAGTAVLTSLHKGGPDAIVRHIAQALHAAPETVARHVGVGTARWGAVALLGLATLYTVEAIG